MSDKSATPKSEDQETAFTYSWEFLKYHAQQRQAAFRFYLIIIGALVALGISDNSAVPMWGIGLGTIFFSFLFWRLDLRNASLVKLAEAYLKIEETRLSDAIGTDTIRIIHAADEKQGPLSWISSYSQIHRAVFALVALGGGALIAPSALAFVQRLFQTCPPV